MESGKEKEKEYGDREEAQRFGCGSPSCFSSSCLALSQSFRPVIAVLLCHRPLLCFYLRTVSSFLFQLLWGTKSYRQCPQKQPLRTTEAKDIHPTHFVRALLHLLFHTVSGHSVISHRPHIAVITLCPVIIRVLCSGVQGFLLSFCVFLSGFQNCYQEERWNESEHSSLTQCVFCPLIFTMRLIQPPFPS